MWAPCNLCFITRSQPADTFTREGKGGIAPVLMLIELDFSLETVQVVIISLKSKCEVLHKNSLKC